MAKNSDKKGDKKGAYAFDELIGFPKMPNLGAMLNPFPSLEPLGRLARTSQLLSDSILPRKTLGAFSPISKLNDPIAAHGTALQSLSGGAAAKIASSALSGSFSHLKTLMEESTYTPFMAIGGTNTILLPSLSKKQLSNRLFPPIPKMPELTSLGSSFSSTMAALRAIEDSFRSLKQMQGRIGGVTLAFSAAIQPLMQSSSLLSKNIKQFQRSIISFRSTTEALRTFASEFNALANETETGLLSSPTLVQPDSDDFESALQKSLIAEDSYSGSGISLINLLSQCWNLPTSAIRWLLTSKACREYYRDIIVGISIYMMTSGIPALIHYYHISSANSQTIAYKREYLPNESIGRIALGRHTLYREPSKLALPVLEVSKDQKVILHNEESNGWRKVSVAKKKQGEWLVYAGWIEGSAYDAIP